MVEKKKRAHKNKKKEFTHKPITEFYSEEQKRKEEVEKIEQEIFEHMKKHTKKTLKN